MEYIDENLSVPLFAWQRGEHRKVTESFAVVIFVTKRDTNLTLVFDLWN